MCFLSFARKFGDKYGKKLMNTPTKNRNRCCEKTRRDVLKTAEATGD